MSLKTKLLELFKYEPETDGAQTFNIKSALNDNWDKIEAWAQSVKTALAKLVPTSRTVNGKALAEDVTLTAADIKMPDSEEDVGAAMAKRLGYNDNLGTGINLKEHVKYEYLSLDGSKDSELNGSGGCLILPGWRSGPWGMQMRFDMRWNALFIRRYRDEATLWDDWERLAICAPPEVHGLPLASGFPAQSYANTYYKTQEGIVHLNFCIFRGESTAFAEPETICTMPKGYRPSIVIAAAVGGDGKSFGNGLPAAELHIEPDGRMWFYGADTRINWVYGESQLNWIAVGYALIAAAMPVLAVFMALHNGVKGLNASRKDDENEQ